MDVSTWPAAYRARLENPLATHLAGITKASSSDRSEPSLSRLRIFCLLCGDASVTPANPMLAMQLHRELHARMSIASA